MTINPNTVTYATLVAWGLISGTWLFAMVWANPIKRIQAWIAFLSGCIVCLAIVALRWRLLPELSIEQSITKPAGIWFLVGFVWYLVLLVACEPQQPPQQGS